MRDHGLPQLSINMSVCLVRWIKVLLINDPLWVVIIEILLSVDSRLRRANNVRYYVLVHF